MSRHKKQEVLVSEATEAEAVRFAAPYKYDELQSKNPNGDVNATWAKRDATFTLGYAPKTETSVVGVIYGIVGANPGIAAVALASKVRWADYPNRARSKYLDGIPPIGWAEGYIDGAVSKGYLKAHEIHKVAKTAEVAVEVAEVAETE